MSGDVQKPKGKPSINRRHILSLLLAITGVLLIAVPFVLTRINSKRNDDIIDEFLKQAEQTAFDAAAIVDEPVEPLITALPTPTQTPEAQALDENQMEDQSTPAPEAQTKAQAMSKEEIKKRMTGVLIIDKIDLRMIIMDGVDEATLRVAAGRMPGTDRPGEAGNCVLAGHRSYTFGKYFNRLDELKPGDRIIIKTTDNEFHYEVYNSFIIEPDDLSILEDIDNQKTLTLFTCHPVAVATHRLVVQAKQIE